MLILFAISPIKLYFGIGKCHNLKAYSAILRVFVKPFYIRPCEERERERERNV
jgi:uncharacterized ParB-like nuclease family protein